jgi:zinc transport system ATP-binding protein
LEHFVIGICLEIRIIRAIRNFNMSQPIVQIKDVSFRYNHDLVLEGITMDIPKGEFLGVIGPNGSGKSTLLKIILGLLTPTTGKVFLFGKELSKFTDWHKIGYVPQKVVQQLHFPVTVSEVVSLGLIGTKNPSKNAISDALTSVGMLAFKTRKIEELSGGQKQRVFIARALVSKPELLVLDEPTVGVDVEAQAEFYELLRKLNTEMNLTLILVSHDIDVVANEVTTLACINGKLVCHLPPKKFIKEDYLENVYGKDMHLVVHGH